MSSNHLVPRIIAEIEAEQSRLTLNVIRSSPPEKFLENRGKFFGLEKALDIIKDILSEKNKQEL